MAGSSLTYLKTEVCNEIISRPELSVSHCARLFEAAERLKGRVKICPLCFFLTKHTLVGKILE